MKIWKSRAIVGVTSLATAESNIAAGRKKTDETSFIVHNNVIAKAKPDAMENPSTGWD